MIIEDKDFLQFIITKTGKGYDNEVVSKVHSIPDNEAMHVIAG
ncbi:MAG: hypothetical protein ACLFM1_03055 [Bacteroidales bacterium]